MPGVCGAGPTCPHWHWLSPHQQLWRSLSRLISLTNKTQSFYTIKAELGSTYRSPLILALGAGLFSSVVGSGAVIKVLCCLQVILTQMLIIYNKARTTRKNRSSIILIAVILVLWNNDNWPFCLVVTQIEAFKMSWMSGLGWKEGLSAVQVEKVENEEQIISTLQWTQYFRWSSWRRTWQEQTITSSRNNCYLMASIKLCRNWSER